MKDVITAILSDEAARDSTAVEAALTQQAAAVPWVSTEL
jgi:hypothetical protein